MKKIVSIFLCGIMIATLFTMIVPMNVSAISWKIETVDSTGSVGWFPSIAVDSNDNPHISYYDYTNEALKYAKRTGSTWHIETVDMPGDVFRRTSIALDASDNPHISYHGGEYDLLYARWTGSIWNIETVDSEGVVGDYNSLALDVNDNPHISYGDGDAALKYARWTGSIWNFETVDSTTHCQYTSIALDISNNPHISYLDYWSENLKYAKWTGNSWSIETVDSEGSVGWATSIALDSSGYAHICYWDGTNLVLKYARWTGISWEIEPVDSSSGWSDLALDVSDNPHISYYDRFSENLKYARWTGIAWDIETIDSVDIVSYTSIALDSNDYAHISYFYKDSDDLRYARPALCRISGIVFNDIDQDGIWDPNEYGIWEATITLKDRNGNIITSTITDYDGSYSFDDLNHGTYTLVETNLIGWMSSTSDTVDIILNPGDQIIVNFGDYYPEELHVDPSYVVSIEMGGVEEIYANVCDDVPLTFKVENSGQLESQLRFLTFTAAILDNNVVEFEPPYMGEYWIYLHTGQLRWSGTIEGIFSTERHNGFETSGTQYFDMITWKLPEDVYLEGGLTSTPPQFGYAIFTFYVHAKASGETRVQFFTRSTEDHHEVNIPLADIVDKTNIYHDFGTGLWYPAHNSYDPWDDPIPGNRPGGHAWESRKWVVKPTASAYAKANINIIVS